MTTLPAKSRKLLGQRSVHPLTFTSDGWLAGAVDQDATHSVHELIGGGVALHEVDPVHNPLDVSRIVSAVGVARDRKDMIDRCVQPQHQHVASVGATGLLCVELVAQDTPMFPGAKVELGHFPAIVGVTKLLDFFDKGGQRRGPPAFLAQAGRASGGTQSFSLRALRHQARCACSLTTPSGLGAVVTHTLSRAMCMTIAVGGSFSHRARRTCRSGALWLDSAAAQSAHTCREATVKRKTRHVKYLPQPTIHSTTRVFHADNDCSSAAEFLTATPRHTLLPRLYEPHCTTRVAERRGRSPLRLESWSPLRQHFMARERRSAVVPHLLRWLVLLAIGFAAFGLGVAIVLNALYLYHHARWPAAVSLVTLAWLPYHHLVRALILGAGGLAGASYGFAKLHRALRAARDDATARAAVVVLPRRYEECVHEARVGRRRRSVLPRPRRPRR